MSAAAGEAGQDHRCWQSLRMPGLPAEECGTQIQRAISWALQMAYMILVTLLASPIT